MAVRIIYGAPRSGKTYYAVNHLTKTYYNQSKDGLYSLKKQFKDLVIFSNIDSLKLPHKNLSEAIRTTGGPEKFFSYDYQEKIFRKYPQVCYFIDEAQMIFPDNFRDNKVFNWYQYHGHWGQDIYLMTQDIKLLPRQITVLSEITIKALPRSTSLFGGRDLRYNLMLGAGTEVGDKIVLVKKQSIFDLYCSQNSTEANKVKNPFVKYFIILFIGLLIAGWNFRKFVSGLSSPAQAVDTASVSSSSSGVSGKSNLVDLPGSPSSSVPAPLPFVWVPVSYILQDESLFVVFNGNLVHVSDVPFEFKAGFLRQLLVHVPVDQVQFFIDRDEEDSSGLDSDSHPIESTSTPSNYRPGPARDSGRGPPA